MKYTITFTAESIAEYHNLPLQFVIDNWDQFENYLENFQHSWMGDVLWEDFSANAESWEIILPE